MNKMIRYSSGFKVLLEMFTVRNQIHNKLGDAWWENLVNKGFKGPFVILRAHSRVWMGSMLNKAFCLAYHGSHPNICKHVFHKNYKIDNFLSIKFFWIQRTTATLGTQILWPLLIGGRCSEVPLCYKQGKRDHKIVVAVGKWLLFGGGL